MPNTNLLPNKKNQSISTKWVQDINYMQGEQCNLLTKVLEQVNPLKKIFKSIQPEVAPKYETFQVKHLWVDKLKKKVLDVL